MRITNHKIHRIILKQTSEASLVAIVALMVRPPPLGVPKSSNRLDPYGLETDRGFFIRIVVIKKTINKKGVNNDN